MKTHKTIKWDLLLIGALLLLAGVLYLLFGRAGETGSWAVVRVEGREVARYPMDRDGVYTLNGGTNVIEIKDGFVWMQEADCPDHVCVKMGKKRMVKQVITCLPNLLTVTVEGDGGGLQVDAIVG